MDVPTAIEEVVRELESLSLMTGPTWYGGAVTLALRAAKKAKALATSDYKTLWKMECEDSAAAAKNAEKVNRLYQEERQESMRLYRRLLQYEGEELDPKAHLVQAGAERSGTERSGTERSGTERSGTELNAAPPIRADIWRLLAARNPSLVAQPFTEPTPVASADDDLYD